MIGKLISTKRLIQLVRLLRELLGLATEMLQFLDSLRELIGPLINYRCEPAFA